MQVITIKWWIIKLLKTLCFCTSSLEVDQWNVHCFTLVFMFSRTGDELLMIGDRPVVDVNPSVVASYFRDLLVGEDISLASVFPNSQHDDVIKWKYFPRRWPFVREIPRSPVNSSHQGQWRGALVFSVIRAWINGWVNNREAGDLRRHRAHYGVTVMRRKGMVSPVR